MRKLFCAVLAALALCLPLGGTAWGANFVNIGTVTNGSSGPGWSFNSNILTVTGGSVTIYGSNNLGIPRRVVVQNSADITLGRILPNGTVTPANINLTQHPGFSAFTVNQGATVNLTLNGTNTLHGGNGSAGLTLSAATLNISGAGTLNARTNPGINSAAGIDGGTTGTININGGTIDTRGIGSGAAGIRGGNIRINGGTLEAHSTASWALQANNITLPTGRYRFRTAIVGVNTYVPPHSGFVNGNFGFVRIEVLHGISLSHSDIKNFQSRVQGYSQIPWSDGEITIYNRGTQPIAAGAFAVAISGPDAASFELRPGFPQLPIPAGGSTTFYVRPLTGLTAGTTERTYNARVTVSTLNATPQFFDIAFRVTTDEAPHIVGPTAMWRLSASATSSIDFNITGAPAPAVTATVSPSTASIGWDTAQNSLNITGALAAGSYDVTLTANNGVGIPASLTFTLTVNDTVTPYININTQPLAGKTVTQGRISATDRLSVSATVEQSANQTRTYQWFRNTANSNRNGQLISNATNANFTLPANLAAGIHYFYAVINSPGAAPVTTSVARVMVNPPTGPGGGGTTGGGGGAPPSGGGGGSNEDSGGGCNASAVHALAALLLVPLFFNLLFKRKK